ncbi:MAG TPA: chorismate synthase [Chitinophagales bacterium]|jgi:chorismate synthase|nr:chorismate synthase [Chitinophagales bacterium]MBP6153500.1 chorismate synthase [Chitinophagales bacterium]HQV78620.1 chorismate synthase [Chitinophagales bacterium]HQW78994.1 chorismate synthase [Chitinophagales bacterium]HRB19212.1 chorismate synthase [Chitinophagales bacterium]
MAGNTFGELFRITTFGESHGVALGVIIDGCPAGLKVDTSFIQSELDRRKPGQSSIVTQRKEADEFEILSGIYEGVTQGTPIGIIIRNEDQKSKDYDHIKDNYRPSHADFTYDVKYGTRDHRGGGRSSARETAVRVAAAAIAKMLLQHYGITVQAYVSKVGSIALEKNYDKLDLSKTEDNIVRCPDAETAVKMIELIKQVKKEGDTIGGFVSCVISGVPAGLGEPVFDKLHADLGKAMLSINAAKGFEYGSGFEGTTLRGSQHNDEFYISTKNEIKTKTNHSGGIQGGISNGMDIYFNVAFKPIATIMHEQPSIDKFGNTTSVTGRGRHDPCVLPRAVPIVEAMAALVIADHLLRNRSSKI